MKYMFWLCSLLAIVPLMAFVFTVSTNAQYSPLNPAYIRTKCSIAGLEFSHINYDLRGRPTGYACKPRSNSN